MSERLDPVTTPRHPAGNGRGPETAPPGIGARLPDEGGAPVSAAPRPADAGSSGPVPANASPRAATNPASGPPRDPQTDPTPQPGRDPETDPAPRGATDRASWTAPDPQTAPLDRDELIGAVGTDAREDLVVVDGLVKHFPILGGVFRRHLADVRAVDGVSFSVKRGEVLGLVGESGCGKTTLGRTILHLYRPTSGRVVMDGRDLGTLKPAEMRRMRAKMQIIFQDPYGSLNPRMPVLDIIGENLIAQGVHDRKARVRKVEDALEAVGLRRDYTRRYPHEFSGGQRQRIGIARALALDPDFIVCDEAVSALDVSIQSQILNLLLDLRRDFGFTYLFIAHNLSVVQYISDRVGVMYLGRLVELAPVADIYERPRHPYTVALLTAVPEVDPDGHRRRIVLKGDVPSPVNPPAGCHFHPRCWLRERLGNPEICATQDPRLVQVAPGHGAACHFADRTPAEAARLDEVPAVV